MPLLESGYRLGFLMAQAAVSGKIAPTALDVIQTWGALVTTVLAFLAAASAARILGKVETKMENIEIETKKNSRGLREHSETFTEIKIKLSEMSSELKVLAHNSYRIRKIEATIDRLLLGRNERSKRREDDGSNNDQ